MKQCTLEDCENKGRLTRDLCQKHYMRWFRHGDSSAVNRIYGEARTSHPLYATYQLMLGRCNNPTNSAYSRYGGRGIKVCDRWTGVRGFNNFVTDTGKRPEGMSLERKNNDSGYSPKNCKWANNFEQAHNRRIFKTNKTGVIGVFKVRNRYRASIRRYHDIIHLGYFNTVEEASYARKLAEKKYSLNNTNNP